MNDLKKISRTFTVLILVFPLIIFAQEGKPKKKSSSNQKATNHASDQLGLISYLVRIKSDGETKMSELMSLELYQDVKGLKDKDEKHIEFVINADRKYNALKLAVDQYILQMVADMKRRNSLRVYKKADNTFKQLSRKSYPNGFGRYPEQIKVIDESLTALTNLNAPVSETKMALIELSIPELGDVWGVTFLSRLS